MVEEGLVARRGESRVSTGNPSLDGMLEGGLVAHRPYLVVGPSGTGKSTLSLQFLCDGIRRGERVLLVTLEEPPNESRINHRGLQPLLDRVEVFDAIPDIMRYERAPFKDIASVRHAVPFAQVPFEIRKSPELASVEVTITALEQMLRTEVIRKGYTRLVVDSLTALQYFCMKGFDPVAGAQSFLRFLSDLRVTTILTVEAPLEDVETPERMLARGEIRLFRWELDGQTVRAIGVEKFRGSSHDVRLHPYRIGPQGIDINLEVTISRDTRQIIEPIVRPVPAVEAAAPAVAPFVSPVTPLIDEVRDLVLLGADVAPARTEIEAALAATNGGHLDEARAHLSRVSSLVIGLVDTLPREPMPAGPDNSSTTAALQRVLARADSVRTGVPPTSLPESSILQVQLGALLSLLPPSVPPPPPPPGPLPTALPAPVPPPKGEAPGPAALPPSTPVVEPVPPVEVVPPPVEGPPPPPATLVPSPPEAAKVAEGVPGAASAPGPSAEVTLPTPPPPPAETAPPPHEMPKPAAPSRKALPPPPKPRSPLAGPRVSKPAPAPLPKRGGAKEEEPPPLPTATMPEWLTHPPLLPEAPLSAPSPGAPVPAPSPSVPGTAPARTARAPAKRRRKSPPPGGAKKGAPPSHVPPVPEEPRMPAPEAVAPRPSEVAQGPPPAGAPAEAVIPSRGRRRAARKRKAPPVVAVSVEPIPPGVFGTSDGRSSEHDPEGRSAPPEG